jgi:hypothetical protein
MSQVFEAHTMLPVYEVEVAMSSGVPTRAARLRGGNRTGSSVSATTRVRTPRLVTKMCASVRNGRRQKAFAEVIARAADSAL